MTSRRTKSNDCEELEKEDMIQFTLRAKQQFTAKFDGFQNFPFDQNEFNYRFEIPSIYTKNENDDKIKMIYHFDFYPTVINSVSWKKNSNKLPEFHIDYNHT